MIGITFSLRRLTRTIRIIRGLSPLAAIGVVAAVCFGTGRDFIEWDEVHPIALVAIAIALAIGGAVLVTAFRSRHQGG